MDLLLFGVPSAIVGARIYFVAFKWEDYKNNLWDVFKIWNGGIAIYGALIGAIICALIFVKKRGYNFWRIADICAVITSYSIHYTKLYENPPNIGQSAAWYSA